MVATDNGPLQEAPHVFHRVDVNFASCFVPTPGWIQGLSVPTGPLRTGGPLASEVATYPLPVAAVARVAPPAAAVAAFVQKYPAAALPGAELDPAQLRRCQELRRRLRQGPHGAVQPRTSVIPAPVPAPTV